MAINITFVPKQNWGTCPSDRHQISIKKISVFPISFLINWYHRLYSSRNIYFAFISQTRPKYSDMRTYLNVFHILANGVEINSKVKNDITNYHSIITFFFTIWVIFLRGTFFLALISFFTRYCTSHSFYTSSPHSNKDVFNLIQSPLRWQSFQYRSTLPSSIDRIFNNSSCYIYWSSPHFHSPLYRNFSL